MKKINNLKDLKDSRQQLKQQQQLLEYKIQDAWKELKHTLTPSNLAKSIFENPTGPKEQAHTKKEGFLNAAFNYGAGFLQQQLLHKVTKRIFNLFKK